MTSPIVRSINGTNCNFMLCVEVEIPGRMQRTNLDPGVDSGQLERPEY